MHDDFQIEKNGNYIFINVNYDNDLFYLLKGDQKVDNLKNIDEIVEGQHYINPVNGHNGNNLCN